MSIVEQLPEVPDNYYWSVWYERRAYVVSLRQKAKNILGREAYIEHFQVSGNADEIINAATEVAENLGLLK